VERQLTRQKNDEIYYIEGTVMRYAGSYLAIYVYEKHKQKIAHLVGKRVKLIVIHTNDEDKDEE